MNAEVSVIIPTHNRASLLQRALDSVLAQHRPAGEVIVVDDGSTDDTAHQVREHYPTVRYLYQPNRGVASARNRGIRAATRPWLAFLDADDQWLPDKLARQLAALAREPHYRIGHGEEIWIRHGRRVNPMKKHAKTGGWLFERCLPRCVISPSAVIVHREVFDAVGLFDESLPACEDYDLWLRVCIRFPVQYLPEPLIIKYGGHEDQLSRRYWGMDRFRVQALEKLLAGENLDEAQRRATLETLRERLRILAHGARKRGRLAEAADYEQRLRRHGGE